jgi:glycosyltransferase involved in cell wall biosynthesis
LLALASLDDVKATIIGDGPEYPHMVDLARQLGLGCKAHFLGRQPEDEVYRT